MLTVIAGATVVTRDSLSCKKSQRCIGMLSRLSSCFLVEEVLDELGLRHAITTPCYTLLCHAIPCLLNHAALMQWTPQVIVHSAKTSTVQQMMVSLLSADVAWPWGDNLHTQNALD